MDILFKDNIKFKSFDDETKLREHILRFIYAEKSKNILYKGVPDKINYKTLKKIIPFDEIEFNENKDDIKLSKFITIDKEKNIREIYDDFLTHINSKYCVIYKD